ncbi:MAG: Hpt domain-containing protein [Bdellovibrionota bacterium]|nr:Hpt domain-containing protein [Bdellovibrionota bacterium]
MGRYEVSLDEDLMDIMESFIDLTEKDMQDLSVAFESKNTDATLKLAHTLKGDSGGYGFSEMSEISRSLELAVKDNDENKMLEYWQDLQEYWQEVKHAYEEAKGRK